MSQPLIRIEQGNVAFSSQPVLEDISLELQQGEIVTLVGPNGSGKTTLVRVLLGLLSLDSGTVWRTPKLRVGYMPQKLGVHPTLPLTVKRFLQLVPGTGTAEILSAFTETSAIKVLNSPLHGVADDGLQAGLVARVP